MARKKRVTKRSTLTVKKIKRAIGHSIHRAATAYRVKRVKGGFCIRKKQTRKRK